MIMCYSVDIHVTAMELIVCVRYNNRINVIYVSFNIFTAFYSSITAFINFTVSIKPIEIHDYSNTFNMFLNMYASTS